MNKLDSLKIVLSVVDPEYFVEWDIYRLRKDEKLLKSTIKLAEKNGLYYYFIYRLKELCVEFPQSEEERWREEKQKLSEFKKALLFLNTVSAQYGINYIVIKEYNTIPQVSRDIDIFVHKADRQKLIKVLEDNDMELIHSSVAETKLKGKYMKIDIYTEICYIGVDFIDDEFLFQSKTKGMIFGTEYPRLNGEANLHLTLVHSLFGHRTMTLLDFLHINYLINDINVDACKMYACERGWGKVFDLILECLDDIYESIYKKGENNHGSVVFAAGGGLELIRTADHNAFYPIIDTNKLAKDNTWTDRVYVGWIDEYQGKKSFKYKRTMPHVVFLVVIDGANYEVLQNKLGPPQYQSYIFANATTTFPATTFSSQASLFTSVYPGTHEIPGDEWKDGTTPYSYMPSNKPTENPNTINNHLPTGVKTLYEYLDDAGKSKAVLGNMYHKGIGTVRPDEKIDINVD